jgi:Protein of unknown function (DUF3152)
VPAHSTASRHHPTRWAVLCAVLAVVALVVILRPAVGHGDSASTPLAPVATTSAAPTTLPPTTLAATPAATTPKRTTPAPSTPVVIPASASGQLVPVPGTAGPSGPGTRLTYRVEVEAGLPLDGTAVAAQVQRTLTDPRGWQPIAGVAFVRTAGPASFELILASPALVDRLCYPLDTVGELSCRNGDKVILNAKRWATAVPWYRGHLDDYRAYLVNHEVGHRLGHGHKSCPAPGAPAPVMVQQSKSLYGCAPNPWPSVAA